MMAHAPLLRTNTAPVFQSDGVARLQNTMSLGGPPSSSRVSQLSGSTAFNSTTSLNTLSSTTTMSPTNSNQVMATSNIINQKADASRSLYQICVALKQRLAQVPGFESYMQQLEEWAALDTDDGGPVESLWRLLRTGHPLLTIYNALQPEKPLVVDQALGNEGKRSKIAIANFVRACLNDLKPPPAECFIINDLTGTDTTGLVKVITVINYVLDLAEQRNLLLQIQPYPEEDALQPGSQMSYRDYIVRELVDTERKYVQDLENLHDLKKTLEERGLIPGDVIYNIFLNINAILDFQRRFLIRVETTNSMPQARQEWGAPFVYYEDAFSIYQPFIANQRKAARIAKDVFEKLQLAQHPVACDFNTLDGFLLKPMQRLVKYPLLLKDLLKKSEDPATKTDLANGIAAAERVLQQANEAVDRDMLDEALDDLINRVDDWKNHKVDQFGKLLLHGVYTVVTGKNDQEKDKQKCGFGCRLDYWLTYQNLPQYEIYLFECILLCCKEVSQLKVKDKKDKTKSTGPKPRNKNAKLQLKGRIFMTNVTDVLAISKTGKPRDWKSSFSSSADEAGSYTCQIWWKGDPGVENFMIKFQNEETLKKWSDRLTVQKDKNAPQQTASPDQTATNFAWMQTAVGLENPYAQQQDDDDDDEPPYGNGSASASSSFYASGVSQHQQQAMAGTMPRNGSTASLQQRARSTTQDSQTLGGNGMPRAPPPRFALPQPPTGLSVQTQMGQQSPSLRQGPDASSYFSPTAESPASSRTSQASGFFGQSAGFSIPKVGTPQPSGWSSVDDHQRYTAPAMPRAPSRDGPSPVNAYGMISANGRGPRGPSMPVMSSHAAAQLQQQRSRSYSTPDINGQQANNARRQNGQSVPAVPGIPPHLAHERHDSNIPRSNSGSPANDLPMRSGTQSPGIQRERQKAYGGTMAQFPAQPVYPRQSTPSNGVTNLPPPGPPPPGMAPLPPADISRTVTPALPTPSLSSGGSSDIPLPTQLKVKVNCDMGNYVTLVVAFNITYQSLIDRIDAKLNRFTGSSIGRGNLKLRYQDEDGDFITISSDDDIQIAISEWREGLRDAYAAPSGVGEIELFCVGLMES